MTAALFFSGIKKLYDRAELVQLHIVQYIQTMKSNNGCMAWASATMNIKLLKTATKMKATRQLFSLCLVIGMTIASYAVPFSPPDSTGVPTTFTRIQSCIYNTIDSGSGSKFLSKHCYTTTSLSIGDAYMFNIQYVLISWPVGNVVPYIPIPWSKTTIPSSSRTIAISILLTITKSAKS